MDELKTFPKNEIQALAMLYVQQNSIPGMTPENLLALYDEAVEKMNDVRDEQYGAQFEEL